MGGVGAPGGGLLPSQITWVYGDGADGAAAFDGSGAVTGATRSGSTYTLDRDVQYTSITVSANVTVKCQHFRIRCSGTCTINSTGAIQCNGNDASGSTAGGSLPNGSLSAGPLGAGATGGTGVGAASTDISAAIGNAGGAGGSGTPNAGGAAGSITAPAVGYGHWRDPFSLVTGQLIGASGVSFYRIGNGGGAGGGDNTNPGGGGGGAAGHLHLAALTIVNNGTISANGGLGGTIAVGNCGGGGGGAGGIVVTISRTMTGTPTANGGAGGTKNGTGVNGSAGGAGFVISFKC